MEMRDPTTLQAAIAEFERLVAELGKVARRSDSERRVDLVRLRRTLSSHVLVVRDAGAVAFGSAMDAPLAQEFRSRLSVVQSAIALHQGGWPAISIDEGNDEYLRSARNVADINNAFIAWVRGAVLS